MQISTASGRQDGSLDISGFIMQSQLSFLKANLRGRRLYFYSDREGLSRFSVWRVNLYNVSFDVFRHYICG